MVKLIQSFYVRRQSKLLQSECNFREKGEGEEKEQEQEEEESEEKT